MKQIPFYDVDFSGFWGERQEKNRTVTIPSVYHRFSETGRFDAFRCDWKEGDEPQPHFFWDSDVAKWIESAAYSLEKHPDEALMRLVDETVELIEQNQGADGYFNIFFTVCEPENRFENRMCHELYCAGHLAEAAVAYRHATGKDKLLVLMEKYLDYIRKVFVTEDSAAFSTPGHEEIELALVRMWEATGEEKYLSLARHFVNTRGTSEKDENSPYYISHAYDQSHKPVREQHEAVGHSVRAVYLYCAMADLARIDGDEALASACRDLVTDIADKKMYVTGGIGGSLVGEAFGEDYDLPNELAYSETCAAIGFALFLRRMSLLEPNGRYDDLAERAIYNGVLAGNSLDGKAFFYENPLEINLTERRNILLHRTPKQHLPITERLEVFGCSCCPPNFSRFVASLGDFLYSEEQDTIYVHHYAKSTAHFDGITLTQDTEYPRDGSVLLTFSGAKGKTAALRVPGWCRNPGFLKNGTPLTPEIRDGFAFFKLEESTVSITADFPMEAVLLEANPKVQNSFGRVCLQYGPVVYCLEGKDNPGSLRCLAVSRNPEATVTFEERYGMNTIETNGYRYTDFPGLYRPVTNEKEPLRLHFIPYCCFANAGESDMLVWVRCEDEKR